MLCFGVERILMTRFFGHATAVGSFDLPYIGCYTRQTGAQLTDFMVVLSSLVTACPEEDLQCTSS